MSLQGHRGEWMHRRVYLLNGKLGRLLLLEVHKSVALGVAGQVRGDLARQNAAKVGEGVVESLVVDGLVQVLDEDVAHARLAESRVAVAPHDAHGLASAIRAVTFRNHSL